MVTHRDVQGRVRVYDFGTFPVPEPLQHSLATLFAAKCAPGGGWDSVESSEGSWYLVRPFAEFLSQLDDVPVDVDRLTPGHWQAWRLSLPPSSNGYSKYGTVALLLLLWTAIERLGVGVEMRALHGDDGGLAAIDGEGDPVNVGRARRDQKADGFGDLLGRCATTCGQ